MRVRQLRRPTRKWGRQVGLARALRMLLIGLTDAVFESSITVSWCAVLRRIVQGRHSTCDEASLVSALGQKQTCAVQLGMSALGQKQTYALQKTMSGLPPIPTVKADIAMQLSLAGPTRLATAAAATS